VSDQRLTYSQAGVDPEKAAGLIGEFRDYQKSRPRDPMLLSGIGPFASCYSLRNVVAEHADPVLVTSCDGVGTKVKLALEWGELGGLGQDLVAMNVNDLLCAGARPLLFLDYYACGELRGPAYLSVLRGIQAACEACGCTLAGGETAEMPGVYSGQDIDLAGFTVGVVDRARMLGPERVSSGDVLLGIESSGPHANGFSLVRQLVARERLDPRARVPFGEGTWAERLLAPTRLFVPLLADLLDRLHAGAHVTGGGLFENLPRVLPQGHVAAIDSRAWGIPPLFEWLAEKAGLQTKEALSTFNCGVGFILVVSPSEAASIREIVAGRGIRCWEIGRVEKAASAGPARVEWR